MIKSLIALITLSFLILISCSKEIKDDVPAIKDSVLVKDSISVVKDTIPALPVIKYKMIKSQTYKWLLNEYDTLGTDIILALNRVDKNRVRYLDSIVVPDTILNDKNYYSPFPKHIDLLEKVKKILLIDQKIQAFAAYENGNLVKWGATSTGKKSTPTPNGLFATNWKAKRTVSTDNDEWILFWYFNLENRRGVSLHQYELPGYPASHACVRLSAEDGYWIYYWANQWILTADGEKIIAYGTPVLIFGDYNYKGIKPWKLLPTDPAKAMVDEDKLESEIQKHILTIISRQEQRDKILNINIDSTLVTRK